MYAGVPVGRHWYLVANSVNLMGKTSEYLIVTMGLPEDCFFKKVVSRN